MSPQPAVEASPSSQSSQSAKARLEEIRRSLQSMLKRRPTAYEAAARDRAAWMLLRAEIATRDPKATSADVVRLDNASRRARLDFERIAQISSSKPAAQPAPNHIARLGHVG